MRRFISVILVLASVLLCFCACSEPQDSDVTFGTYIYDSEAFGPGDFTITLNEDGTFNYYEGGFSSYIGDGEWEVDGNVIRLRDRYYSFVNCFEIKEDRLVNIQNDSTGFMYVDVLDGAQFLIERAE